MGRHRRLSGKQCLDRLADRDADASNGPNEVATLWQAGTRVNPNVRVGTERSENPSAVHGENFRDAVTTAPLVERDHSITLLLERPILVPPAFGAIPSGPWGAAA